MQVPASRPTPRVRAGQQGTVQEPYGRIDEPTRHRLEKLEIRAFRARTKAREANEARDVAIAEAVEAGTTPEVLSRVLGCSTEAVRDIVARTREMHSVPRAQPRHEPAEEPTADKVLPRLRIV